MGDKPLRSAGTVLAYARLALHMTQREFGEAVGVSHRTAVRWDAGQSVPWRDNWIDLAKLLAPVDLALASEAAAHGEETLESLGLAPPPPPPPEPPPPPAPEPPPPPPPPPEPPPPPAPEPPPLPAPPPPPPVAPEHLVDAVVCAVAELLDTSPRTLRPMLYTAFKKAREVGLTVEAAEKALAPAVGQAPPPAPAEAPRDQHAK